MSHAPDQEFRDRVVGSLARLESQMEEVKTQLSAQEQEVTNVVRFQHRVLGGLSALSLAASVIVSFAVSAAKHLFSDK